MVGSDTILGQSEKMVFQKLGGIYQLRIDTSEELEHLPVLDDALWCCTSAPLGSFNCDPAFLKYLDTDLNQRIRTDEVKSSQQWLFKMLADRSGIAAKSDVLKLSSIDVSHEEGKSLHTAILFALSNLGIGEPQEISLAQIRDRQKIVSNGLLNGDGIIPSAAIADPELQAYAKDIRATVGAPEATGVDLAMLDKFIRETSNYLAWLDQSKPTEDGKPSAIFVRGEGTADLYNCLCALRPKIDEYFSLCKLLVIEPLAVTRFTLNEQEMLTFDTKNPDTISGHLQSAPLSHPTTEIVLDLSGTINPEYLPQLKSFAEKFMQGETKLTCDQWETLKTEFAPYANWINAKGTLPVENLGEEKLRNYLASDLSEQLRKLLVEDQAVAGEIQRLDQVEKLILFQANFLDFVNNYVSLKRLFDPESDSMLQLGILILDGRHFSLNTKVLNRAEHKKVAEKCSICVMYLELSNQTEKTQEKMEIACAVTSGFVTNLYVGKAGIFAFPDGNVWDAEIVDFIPQPVSLSEAILLPFKKISEFVRNQFDKFTQTQYRSLEAGVGKSISEAEQKLAGKAKPPPKGGGFPWGGLSFLILGGGVSLAALSSAFAYVTHRLSSVSLLHVAIVILCLLLLICLPIIISAFIKLRKRNIGMFLEACGWAVNAPIRLNRRLGLIFSYRPSLPKGAKTESANLDYQYLKKVDFEQEKHFYILVFIIIFIIFACVGASLYKFLNLHEQIINLF